MKTQILVADDEEAIRELLTQFLGERGLDVTSVATAEEALAAIENQSLHLVILDLLLGHTDGLEVLDKIKATHPRLPVLLITGMGFEEELLQEARARGADGYISKSLPLNQLYMEVLRILKYRK